MADFLQAGAQWLAGQLQASCSRPFTARRGTLRADLNATVGSMVLRIDDGLSLRVVKTEHDLIFPAAAFVLGGAPATPQRGDLWDEAVGDRTYTWECSSPGGKEPEWRWADQHRVMMRVHVKLIKVT